MDLTLLGEEYAVCRLPPGASLPVGLVDLVATGSVISATWTPEETSVLCPSAQAPAGALVETPWRLLRVAGAVNLALTGVLASIVGPLGEARVNIFAFSTYDTDYLLVPSVRLSEAIGALTAAGHRINGE